MARDHNGILQDTAAVQQPDGSDRHYLRYVSDYVTHTHLYFQETDFRDPHEMTNGFRDCRMSNLTSVYTQRVPRSDVASGSADVAMLYSYVTQRVETRV